MASYRLIDNRIIDRLSVNKSNKSNKSEETEFDKNMADFIGTWELITPNPDPLVEQLRVTYIFEKVSSNNYTVTNSVLITLGGEDIQLINKTEPKQINFAGKRTCTLSTAYDEYLNFYRALPTLGVPVDVIPYNGSNTTYTISLDKQTLVSKSEIYIDRDLVLEQAKLYPIIAASFFEEMMTSQFAYFKTDGLKKIN